MSVLAVALALALVAGACGRSSSKSSGGGKAGAPAAVPGFDPSTHTINLGVLTPQTGIAAVIGNPLTNGNQAYVKYLNSKGGIDGKYKVNLIIKDNKYTTQDTITQYAAIKDQVVGFMQILGTPPVNAVLPTLERDNALAGPATLDAPWYTKKNLMPILAPYQVQAANAISYYENSMGGKGKTVCAITSDDPYGNAGEQGAKFAAQQLGFKLADSEKFTAGATDYTAQIDGLQSHHCEMVWITSLPTDLGAILARAAQVNFTPQWIGQSPTWVSQLLSSALKPYLEAHFLLASEGVEWGDRSAPGMTQLLDALPQFAPGQKPDIYYVFGWMQALAYTQIVTQAVKDGDLSHQGLINAMGKIGTLDFGGLVASEKYGLPNQRVPQRETTLFKPTSATLDTNGGLSYLAPNAKNFTTPAGKAVPLS
jgi:ABC-type branched-subunit amino acid transport system substrate-binding protein